MSSEATADAIRQLTDNLEAFVAEVKALQKFVEDLTDRLSSVEDENSLLRAKVASLELEVNNLKGAQARRESEAQNSGSSEDEIEVIDFRHGVCIKLKNSDDTHGDSNEEMET
jgi:predicted nuclease with TOPRIM domain